MGYKTINEANEAVIQKIIAAEPFLTDVVPAKSVIPELEDYVLLHAGPPIKYENMTDPMQGSCVGAILLKDGQKMKRERVNCLKTIRLHLFHVIM